MTKQLRTPRLQPAQVRLLPYIAAGWSTRQIAAALGWTQRTVRDQVSKIICLLALDNRAQVGLWAIAAGHVDAEMAVSLLLQQAPHLEVP